MSRSNGSAPQAKIFDIPTGDRVEIKTGSVTHPLTGVKSTDVSFYATATDRYGRGPDGKKRRLFVDANMTFVNGKTEIWLSND